MKPIVLHPSSVVVGIALAIAAVLVLGAQAPQVQSFLHPPPRTVEHHIIGIPDPRNFVTIREEDGPYTVPAGKRLVITSFGETRFCADEIVLYKNGVAVIAVSFAYGMPALSPGIAFDTGDVLALGRPQGCSVAQAARALGYLVDV